MSIPELTADEVLEHLKLLKPEFPGKFMLVTATIYTGSDDIHRKTEIHTSESIATQRVENNIAYAQHVSVVQTHHAIYRWDVDAHEWALMWYVPAGTSLADLPWRL